MRRVGRVENLPPSVAHTSRLIEMHDGGRQKPKAAVAVLQGGTAPAPFDIASKKEALRVLAHYIGDVHQPLHVGAIYLNASGTEVDPDHTTFDPATKTRGGNQLVIGPRDQLHHEWDSIPDDLKMPQFKSEGVTAARAVAVTSGVVDTWPVQWATESVLATASPPVRSISFTTSKAGPVDGAVPSTLTP